MNDSESASKERPVSFIRSTKVKRYVVIWTREVNGTEYVDPIGHVHAHNEEHAAVLALKMECPCPATELSVKEDPKP